MVADDIVDSGYYAYRLSVTATVTEDGTGEEFKGEAVAAIERTALEFLYIGKEEYSKPNLPFTGKVWQTVDYVLFMLIHFHFESFYNKKTTIF